MSSRSSVTDKCGTEMLQNAGGFTAFPIRNKVSFSLVILPLSSVFLCSFANFLSLFLSAPAHSAYKPVLKPVLLFSLSEFVL